MHTKFGLRMIQIKIVWLHKGKERLCFKDHLGSGKAKGWCHPQTRKRIFNNAKKEKVDKLKVPTIASMDLAKLPAMKNELKSEIVRCRNRKARVSSKWIKIKAKTIASTKYSSISFKASNGWFLCFLRRNKIKFRKRGNCKYQSAKDKRSKIMEWHSKDCY